MLSILYALYIKHKTQWVTQIGSVNEFTVLLTREFKKITKNQYSKEKARDNIRSVLNASDAATFPFNETGGTDIYSLSNLLLAESEDYYYRQHRYKNCNICEDNIHDRGEMMNAWQLKVSYDQLKKHVGKTVEASNKTSNKTITEWIKINLIERTDLKCQHCNNSIVNELVFKHMPIFFQCYIENIALKWESTFVLRNKKYRLCGLVYFGTFHFTTRIIMSNGDIYFNNSISNGKKCHLEGNIKNAHGNFLSTAPDGRKCILAIYVMFDI